MYKIIKISFLTFLLVFSFSLVGQAQVQPTLLNVYINEALQFSPNPVYLTATALYADGSTRDVTYSGTWQTSNPSVATVHRGKVEFGSNTGTVTITFALANKQTSVGTEVVDLTEIKITNTNVKYSERPVQLKAQGRYNHGQLREINDHLTWYSVNENVARVDNAGLVTFTGRSGKAFIGVLFTSPLTRQTIKDEIAITVTEEEVRKSAPTPTKSYVVRIDGELDPTKTTNTLRAYRLFIDNTRQTLGKEDVNWTSSNPHVATVDNTGKVTFTGQPGNVTVTAWDGRYSNLRDSREAFVPYKTVALSINESLNYAPLFLTSPPKLTVTGIDNSGRSQLVYNLEWSSSNPTIATIDNQGQTAFTGRPGTVTFTAKKDNLSATASSTIPEEQARRLRTMKITDNLFYSTTPQELQAVAYYTDGTTKDVTKESGWQSSNENVATVHQGVVYFTGAPGRVTITTNFEVFQDSVETVVRPSSHRQLETIRFQKNYLSYADQDKPLVVMGIYSDNTSRPLTNIRFSSFHPNIVRVVNNRLAFSGNPGRAIIEANAGGFRATMEVEVDRPQGVNQPAYIHLVGNLDDFHKTKILRAFAVYPDGSQQDITDQAVWNTTNKNIGNLVDKGKVEVLGGGPYRISASFGSHTAYMSNNAYYQFGRLHPLRTNLIALEQIKVRANDQLAKNLYLPPLVDVSGHWAERDIQLARRLGWMGGYPDGTMGPNRPISRGEFASLIQRSLGLTTNSRSFTYLDLDNYWAKESVHILANLGLVPLDGTRNFRPYDPITRGEMAQILANLIEVRADRYYPYLDVPPNHPARGAIANVTQAKIMTGIDELYFRPQDSATRAQTLTVLLRLLKTDPEMQGILNRVNT